MPAFVQSLNEGGVLLFIIGSFMSNGVDQQGRNYR